ncbi:MAG: universal stress protein [Chloroflexota bacterium]
MSTPELTSANDETAAETQNANESLPNREILVPLDGSALAEAVLPQALMLARITSGGLVLMRVANAPLLPWVGIGTAPPLDPDLIDDMWRMELEGVRSYLSGVAQRLAPAGVPVRSEVLRGEAAQAIVEYLEQHTQTELAAMATHGRSGLRGWVLGSVAEKVLQASPKPLLLVRPSTPEADLEPQAHPTPAQTYRTILVPLDGSLFAEQALERARDLAHLAGAELVLVTVMLGSDDYKSETVDSESWAIADRQEAERLTTYLAQTAEQLRAGGITVRTQLMHGYPPEEILKAGEQEHADLIVMATHGRGGLQRLWLGSVAMKMVQASGLPILLVRPTESR